MECRFREGECDYEEVVERGVLPGSCGCILLYILFPIILIIIINRGKGLGYGE